MQFAVERSSEDGRAVLQVVGELDLATAPALASTFDAALSESPSDVVIDLTPTTFLDSTGCRQLAVCARQGKAQGVRVVLACPPSNGAVRRVLDFLEMQSLVPVVSAP